MCSGNISYTSTKMHVQYFRFAVLLCCSHSDFTAIVELPEGRHEYKFFVDGQWLHDPNEVQYNIIHVCILVHENTCV